MSHSVVEGEMNCLIYRCEISIDSIVKSLRIPADEKIKKIIVIFILCLDSK
jgi:hypothetical protein